MGRLGFFFLLVWISSNAQVKVTGRVIGATAQEPLEGVSVFYDGTTIGTITDKNGNFRIITKKILSAPLIVNFIGFERQSFSISNSGDLGTISLKEKAFELDEVVLKPDTWSREKKLNVFRREFLGKTAAALQCKIRNEKDIRLYFNSEEKVLYAFARRPIRISNRYLGYDIEYTLQDFEVRFSIGSSNIETVMSTYNSGAVLFFEKKGKLKQRHIRNREKAYLGSVLHFMRALSHKKLEEENFKIFKTSTQIGFYDAFEVTTSGEFTRIVQNEKMLNLLYNDQKQSVMQVRKAIFYIDEYGRHTPTEHIFFGGNMGRLRVADMMPSDYEIN